MLKGYKKSPKSRATKMSRRNQREQENELRETCDTSNLSSREVLQKQLLDNDVSCREATKLFKMETTGILQGLHGSTINYESQRNTSILRQYRSSHSSVTIVIQSQQITEAETLQHKLDVARREWTTALIKPKKFVTGWAEFGKKKVNHSTWQAKKMFFSRQD